MDSGAHRSRTTTFREVQMSKKVRMQMRRLLLAGGLIMLLYTPSSIPSAEAGNGGLGTGAGHYGG